MKTKAVFRTWRKTGEVIALFPEIPENRGLCLSYMHIGQHGAACYYHVMSQTKPSTPEESAPLFKELTNHVGYDLQVRLRK